MARSTVTAGGGGARLLIDSRDLEKLSDEFKDARRAVSRKAGLLAVQTGEETVLPMARTFAGSLAVAGSRVSPTLVVRKGRRNGALLTTTMRGKKGRAVGLQEFGGTVRGTIYPKKARALSLRGLGVVVASVKKARTYKGQEFLTRAAQRGAPKFAKALADKLIREFPGG